MKSNAILKVEKGTDGPPTNSVDIHRIILSVVVEGADKPLTTCVGEFRDGYQQLAKEFVDWFNHKVETPP